jgi:hypothetical protein
MTSLVRVGVVIGALLGASPAVALTSCDLRYDLEGWSVFYKEATGSGVVRCDNGQSARVRLETRGGGVTFGRSRIVGGSGDFSPIADISEIFGNYANAEAHAGMGVSSAAQVVTKGPVSLSLSGTGTGVDLGFAFGRFTIVPSSHRRHAEEDVDDEPRRSTRMPDDGY